MFSSPGRGPLRTDIVGPSRGQVRALARLIEVQSEQAKGYRAGVRAAEGWAALGRGA